MHRTESYQCPCGWSRIILDGQTEEDARRIHENTEIHRLALAGELDDEEPAEDTALTWAEQLAVEGVGLDVD